MGGLYVDAASLVQVVMTNVSADGGYFTFTTPYDSVGDYELVGVPAAVDSDGKPVQIDSWSKETTRLFIKPQMAAAKITVALQPTGA